MNHPAQVRICWPKPAARCLEGGCGNCADQPWVAERTVANYARRTSKLNAYHRGLASPALMRQPEVLDEST